MSTSTIWSGDVVRRIDFIDGLRGVAIFGVLLFHAYISAPDHLPFGNKYGWIIPLRLGWCGVELFFLISGFVILMTLEKCRSFSVFIGRRWLRLFPAMFIATVLLLAFIYSTRLGPWSDRHLIDALPGLSFISPALFHAITRIHVESLDTPFWSLYVEVAFYVIFGALYFFAGIRTAIVSILLLAIASYSCNLLTYHSLGSQRFKSFAEAMDWLGFTQFAWFASGAVFYKYFANRQLLNLVLACGIGLIAATIDGLFRFDLIDRMGLISTLAAFAATTTYSPLQTLFKNPILLFFGFISYPLYLIHNNALYALSLESSAILPTGAEYLAPVGPILFLTGVAWVIAKFGEPKLRLLICQVGQQPARVANGAS